VWGVIFPLPARCDLAGPLAAGQGKIAVVCAGTATFQCGRGEVTAEADGQRVDAIHDVAVAGIHRLMQNRDG